MKRLLIASLSTLVLTAVPVYAQEMTAYNQKLDRNIIEVTPFNLVEHGYQGYFSEQGIPSNAAFLAGVRSGKIDATSLVKGAIARHRLNPSTLNNSSYLDAVKLQLDNIQRFSY
jgi:hypothetical protein